MAQPGVLPPDEAVPSRAQPVSIWMLLELGRRRARLVLGTAVLVVASALLYALLQTPVYRATAELLVDPQALQVVGRDIVRTDGSASLDFANVDSQALVMVSTAVLRQVVDQLDLTRDPEFQVHAGLISRLLGMPAALTADQRRTDAVDLLKQSIVIHRVDNALVFQITVSNPDAARSAAIANALAATYLRQVSQERVDAVNRANASLLDQVSGMRAKLDAAEAAVESFRSRNGLIRSSDTGLVVTQQLKDLYTQIDAASAEVSRLAARKDQLAKIGAEALTADTVPDILNSPTIVSLRAQYAQSSRDVASLTQTLLPQHPRMVEARAELAEIQKLLRAELGRAKTSVDDAHAQAVANLAKLQSRATDLTQSKVTSSEAEIKLRQLESEAEAIRSVFNASLNRARELEQQGKIETSNSHILSEATPPARPTKPPLPIVLATAALFGTLAGLGIAYLLEMMPRRPGAGPSTIEAPAKSAGLPVPAAPAARSPGWRSRFLGDRRDATPEHALRPVARDLQRMLEKRLPAVVMIAAVPPGGGARGVADRLAQALADLGEDVLLCDPDGNSDDMRVRRLRPGAQVPAVRPRGGRGSPATQVGGAEFFVAEAGVARASIAMADAIVLAVDFSRIGPEDLADAALSLDPSGRRVVATVSIDAAGVPERVARRPALDDAA